MSIHPDHVLERLATLHSVRSRSRPWAIGFVVDVTQADPYTLPETSSSESASVRAKAAGTSGQAICFGRVFGGQTRRHTT